MFLQNRPELGDVSRGEVVSINNYYRLFKDILTAVQLDGLRLLVTPFPQEEFNPTDDRRTVQPSLGVTCLDCHRMATPAVSFISLQTSGPSNGAYDWTPSVSAACSINKFTGRSEAYVRSRTFPVWAAYRLLQWRCDSCVKKGMNILENAG